MPALFPRWSNTAVRGSLLAILLVLLATPVALMGWVRSSYSTGVGDPIAQPIPFDHRHHVADDGIDCRYCHSTVERAATAGMPSTERCLGCHSQIWNDSPLLKPVLDSWFAAQPIRWRRVNSVPDFVYFDHSIHVSRGVGCETCHGRVDRMARVYQAVPLTMGWCIDCHRSPGARLRPPDAVTVMGWDAMTARDERAPPGADTIRGPTYCSACHR